MASVNHYKCKCGTIFNERDAHEERVLDQVTEFWGEKQVHYIINLLCPQCGENDMDDFKPCEGCEIEEAVDGDDWCVMCMQALGEDHPDPERLAAAAERHRDARREDLLDTIVDIARGQ